MPTQQFVANRSIRDLILSKFPSNSQFAIRLRIYPEKISRALSGKRPIPAAEAARWAAVLDCSLEDLAAITRRNGKGGDNG